jgi:hypothetical protein
MVVFSAAAVSICWALPFIWESYVPICLHPVVAVALSVTTPPAPPARDTGGPVPVTVAPVRAGEVPIYLSAIGTVQAYNTVGVKTRVDGEIIKVLFEEGQDVTEPPKANVRTENAQRLRFRDRLLRSLRSLVESPSEIAIPRLCAERRQDQ